MTTGNFAMTTWGINAIRNGTWFTRVISALIIITFGGLVTSPAVAATRAELERQERITPREQSLVESNSAKLNAALLRVKDELRKVAGKPALMTAAYQSVTAEERMQARKTLKQLRAELRDLDKAAREDFRRIGDELKAKNLPEVILKRHVDAVAKYEAEADALLNDLAAMETADDAKAVEHAAKAFERLSKQQLRRSHQPFDPNQLPNRSLRSDDRRAPRLDAAQFIADADVMDLDLAVAANEGYDLTALADANDAAYLAATPEVTLSDAIRAKAAELDHNPVKIEKWVRNNVQWQPTWGAVQDADLTLSAERGNAFDIASLTLALLRASGIPARYVHGTIEVREDRFRNWIGGFEHIEAATDFAAAGGIPVASVTGNGVVTKVRIEHVWVEAAVDFRPSRGAVNHAADNWVPMDPAFKQYEFLEGLDPVVISGLDPEALANEFLASGTVNEDEGWVAGFDPAVLENAKNQTQQALQDYIDENLPDATVGDVLGGRKIIEYERPILAGVLDNRIVVTGNRYAELPESMRQHITFGFGVDSLGEPQQSVRFNWVELNNERVTLSFRPAAQADEDALRALLPEGEITDISQLPTSIPAYLINVVPELKVGDDVVMTGSAMNLGEELTFVFTPEFAGRYAIPNKYNVIAGSYLAVAVVAGNVSTKALNDSKTRLEATKAILETQDTDQLDNLTRGDLLGDLFHAGLLGYYGQFTALSYVAGIKQSAHHYLAAGIGTFGYEPSVVYTFGVPKSIYDGGVVMNIPVVNVHGYDGDGSTEAKQSRLNYVLQVGTLSSALEHAVPEQFLGNNENPVKAVSAMKALSLAQKLGQPVYKIDSANLNIVLPNLMHSESVLAEIRSAISTGKVVVTHASPVSLAHWSGSGYVIFDPETGDGAYKISGGTNGVWALVGFALIGFMMFLVAATLLIAPIGLFAIFSVVVSEVLLILQAIEFRNMTRDIARSGCSDEDAELMVKDLVFVLVIEAVVSKLLFGKIRDAAKKWEREFYEIVDALLFGGAGYVLETLGNEVTKGNIHTCK